jgi:methylase of polypeptide subunit release factors
MELERELRQLAPKMAVEIREAAAQARNEAEFRTKITRLIEGLATKLDLDLPLAEEYTLINGRADAVYERLVIEYEPPGSLKANNRHSANQRTLTQLRGYVEGLAKRGRHKHERLAGVSLDGSYFIFVRSKEGVWNAEEPVKVDDHSTQHFLRLLCSLSTERALIPENLVKDFGEDTVVGRDTVASLFDGLSSATSPKVRTLFKQWSLQFSEVCDYEEASKLKVDTFTAKFGIECEKPDPFQFFYCLHTYYATFIKLLAVQVVQYYAMPKLGTDLRQASTLGKEELRAYLGRIEQGGIFKELGISNFIEGDFFGWYLDAWDDQIYQSLKALMYTLSCYSLVTLDVDPDTTRDLLKKLYQELMPRQLRHNLGEYYTPDWLAERLLNMLEAGNYEGNPDKRVLDPACGSGTFLVIAIKKIREYAAQQELPESQVLEKILANVVGFDLNPLAVISARTNYLLALGNLLQHRKGEIRIPVYICDSILTPQEGGDLFGKGVLRFNTSVGPFSLPAGIIRAQYMDALSNFLEEAVGLKLDHTQFVQRLCATLPLDEKKDEKDVAIIWAQYERLVDLEKQGINGIWARIIKNAFAPLFAGEFDYVAGNPPWVNWESLPEQYRRQTKPLWEHYGLFPHGGMDTILGKGKKDISMIMTYVAMDKYLKKGGQLGFVITQSVFKTAGSGQGFRRFQLGEKGQYLQVRHVDDMVKLNPFEGASNRTSVVILQKGRSTEYPIASYLYWRKTGKGKSIASEASLHEVLAVTERKQFTAEPVSEADPTSAWITGRPKAVRAVRKVLGQSDYTAHAGSYTGGANAVYWVEIVATRPDGLVLISNVTEGAKREVESVNTAIEPELLFPLLRGKDVQRWKATASAFVIMAQDPKKRRGIDENEMKTRYPKTYMYLKGFEGVLRERAALKRYFMRKDKRGNAIETGPFFSMFNISDYTFAPYKVVWREQASCLTASVVLPAKARPVVPDHKLMLVNCNSAEEAHYVCALLNSAPSGYAAISYAVEIQLDPHILQNVRLPRFNSEDKLHLRLAALSEEAHQGAKKSELSSVAKAEAEIDALSVHLWGLTPEELKDIQASLREMIE